MKGLEKFRKDVGILVKAYLNDTLEHSNCYACAVGNLVAANLGYKYKELEDYRLISKEWINGDETFENPIINGWATVFCMSTIKMPQYFGEAKKQIDSTGYTPFELAMIEKSFETAKYGNSKDKWMYDGLMAVVEVLAEINGVSLEEKESAKALFVK